MQTYLEKIQEQRFLIFSLLAVVFVVLVSNIIGEDVAIAFTSWLYVITVGSMMVLAIIISIQNRITGTQGIGWFLFACTAVLWFAAEMTWDVYELVLDIDPYPSEADYFWIAGFISYFWFLIFYIKPFRRAVSKKIISYAIVAGIVLLIPSLYLSFDPDPEISDIELLVATSYPILDSLVLVPAIIGIILFLRGEVNFLWALMCLAILCDVVADASFLFLQLEESYYSGHPMEILYHWAYILFAFGAYEHLKIFKSKKKVKVEK